MFEGLFFIHNNKIIHRDMKAANILITRQVPTNLRYGTYRHRYLHIYRLFLFYSISVMTFVPVRPPVCLRQSLFRIRITWLRIRILLFSLVAFKMPTKNRKVFFPIFWLITVPYLLLFRPIDIHISMACDRVLHIVTYRTKGKHPHFWNKWNWPAFRSTGN